jgi:DNA-binding NarL/FixJ family response regulator
MSSHFTERELQIIVLVASGRTDKQIALALGGIAVQTVKRHQQHMREKAGVSNRTQLSRYAMERGLAPLPRVR